MSEQDEILTWEGLGQYIQRHIKQRKGVIVPRFGTFTFTSNPVSLEGTTNARDKDLRAPVFIVSNELSPNVRAGIAHASGIRPFQANGFKGKAPTVRLNYTELAQSIGMDKDKCQRCLNKTLRDISDKVRAGQDLVKDIPGLGRLTVKNGIVAVIFDQTQGPKISHVRPQSTPQPQSRALTITQGGMTWLRDNLGVNVDAESVDGASDNGNAVAFQQGGVTATYGPPRYVQTPAALVLAENASRVELMLSQLDHAQKGIISRDEFLHTVRQLQSPVLNDSNVDNLLKQSNTVTDNKVRYKEFFQKLKGEKRPRSVYSGAPSDFTVRYTGENMYPVARTIWFNRIAITNEGQIRGMRPRVRSTPSELLSVLKRAGTQINIHQLKAVLNYARLANASILELLQTVRDVLSPYETVSELSSVQVEDTGAEDSIEKVTRLLKSRDLRLVYRDASGGGGLNSEKFVRYMLAQYPNQIKVIEAQRAFYRLVRGGNELGEEEFCRGLGGGSPGSLLYKIHRWLESYGLSALEGFELLQKSSGSEVLNFDQFTRALIPLNFPISEAQEIFHELDDRQTGIIDRATWLSRLEKNQHQSLAAFAGRLKIGPGDLLQQLKLEKDTITEDDLAQGIRKVDPGVSEDQAKSIARETIGPAPSLSRQQLQQSFTPTQMIDRMVANARDLRFRFEKIDIARCEKLEPDDFISCLENSGMSQAEIAKATAQYREPDGSIHYGKFLEGIQFQFIYRDMLRMLREYVNNHYNNLEEFSRDIGEQLLVSTFGNFLHNRINISLPIAKANQVAQQMDLNRDGVIDIQDLSKCLYGRPARVKQQNDTQLKEDILTRFRQAVNSKRETLERTFRILDGDGKGLITREEFRENVVQYIDFPVPVRDRLFDILDIRNQGVIDQGAFIAAMKGRPAPETPQQTTWDWEQNIIQRIKSWARVSGLSTEEAFRALDADFDGVISKSDLKRNLPTILGLRPEELTDVRVDRIHRLLDQYTRKLSDFRTLLDEDHPVNWKMAAFQQLQNVIAQKFGSAEASFKQISQNSDRVTTQAFASWIKNQHLLYGFYLDDLQLAELFNDIDTARKGFISLADWNTAFGRPQKSLLPELQDAIRSSFGDCKTAYAYFEGFGRQKGNVDFYSFEKAVKALIPGRFQKSQIAELWGQVTNFGQTLNFQQFNQHFGNSRFMGTLTNTASSTRSSAKSSLSGDPLSKLAQLIAASSKDPRQIFEEMDTDNSGKISAIEFRNAIRRFNLGLSAREIDQLLMRIDTNNDGQIDWMEFSQKFRKSGMQNHIKGVASQKINRFRELMQFYMLSAKDAYKQFDTSRNQQMTFEDFNRLVNKLSELSGDSVPAFSVVRDIFDVIDIRKDGVIDMREWLNTFKDQQGLQWEDSKAFEDIAAKISKNRKVLQMEFDKISRAGLISFAQAVELLTDVLREFRLSDQQWRILIRPADKKGSVDFRLLLDICKERATVRHPRPTQFTQF